MKNIRYSLVVIAILAMTFTGCRNNQFSTKSLVNYSETDVEEAYKSPKQIKMNIEGMVCAVGCAAMIEKNLNKTNWLKLYLKWVRLYHLILTNLLLNRLTGKGLKELRLFYPKKYD